MVGFAGARGIGPSRVCCVLDRRRDEPASAAAIEYVIAENRVFRTDWDSAFEVQRQSTPSIGRDGEKAGPQAARTGGDHLG